MFDGDQDAARASLGLSWQIVPQNMGELMERPGAYGKMLEMGKLIIDDF
jgi:predicted 3-demethylubiquinone-9 3-methyltransferase (glyoxalase superfamily)